MRELTDILRAWRDLRAAGGRAVLATIVDCSGSTYRRAGARMLIPERGDPVGLLSGGCLEGDLAERAAAVLDSGRPATALYDMTRQDDLVWGLGLGCAGIVHVLLEPLPGEAEALLELVGRVLAGASPGAVATRFDTTAAVDGGVGRMLLDPHDGTDGSLGDAATDRAVTADLRARAGDGGAVVRRYGPDGAMHVLVESLDPPQPLLVFGAGADVPPVVRLAAELGWKVSVVDDRPALARAERFPGAAAVVACEPAEVPARLGLEARAAALVMTHRFLHDVELARVLVPSAVRYLGFLGPKARTDKLLAELRERGVEPTATQLARVFGPAGVDIGAETPEEIALAIVAEIRAVLAGRPAGYLRERQGPLHERGS